MRVRRSAAVIAALVIGILASQTAVVGAQAVGQAVVASNACAQNEIPANDDNSSSKVALPFALNFFGTLYTDLWVNNNGNVTFNGPLSTFTPFGLLDTNTPIIAPFFADVDTSPEPVWDGVYLPGEGPEAHLTRYGYGETVYNGRPAFCVNWIDVGYFAGGVDKRNSFQLLLVSREDKGAGAFDIVFNYDKIQWEAGRASGGVAGLGGQTARAGFSSGTGGAGSSTELAGSGIAGSFLDSSDTGLIHGKQDSPVYGRYVYSVRGDGVVADTYVAMGDSFQSGEGAFDYELGTNIPANMCHRSKNAYPHLLVRDQAVRLELDFRACSGALMADLSSDEKDGIAQYDALGDDTKLVTIGIGGNDLDFSGIVRDCIINNVTSVTTPFGVWLHSCENQFDAKVSASIASLEPGGALRSRLRSVYLAVKERAPHARVVVLNYPQFFPNSDWVGCSGVRPMDGKWMNDSIRKADKRIIAIAKEVGFEYVDMSDVLSGHEQCTSEPGMNGLLVTDGAPANESYHPNVLGHRLMADRIEAKLEDTIVPSFVIQPGETVSKDAQVSGAVLSVNVTWPGSDVVTTLISPSGVRYERAMPRTAEHGNGETYEYYTIDAPEPGTWTVEMFGREISEGGEPVVLTVADTPTPNRSPVASISASGSGLTYTFDASASADTDGVIDEFKWDFGDGTFADGPVVQHTFATDANYTVAVQATDDADDSGFDSIELAAATAVPASYSGQYFGSSTTLSAQTAIAGPVRINGDLVCSATAQVLGDVTVTGNAHITTGCKIDGDLIAGGNIIIDASPVISGDVTSSGNLSFVATAKVAGDVSVGGTFSSPDGKTRAYLISNGRIGGTITDHAAVPIVSVDAPIAQTYDAASSPSATRLTWTALMNQTAELNHAPSWSAGLTAQPGCLMAPTASSVNGATLTVSTATVIDARRATSGCASISMQQMTVALGADLTVYSDGFKSVNGLHVVSSDGLPHTIRVIVPGPISGCATAGEITLSTGSTFDSPIRTELYTPGKVILNGTTSLHGSSASGCFAAVGTSTIAVP